MRNRVSLPIHLQHSGKTCPDFFSQKFRSKFEERRGRMIETEEKKVRKIDKLKNVENVRKI